jgi:Carboxypeptidase regulatory-like domain
MTSRFLLACSLCASFLLTAAAAHSPQKPVTTDASTYFIAGVVVDAVTGDTLPRAQVSLAVEGEQVVEIADDNGRFRISGLEAGKYPLYAKAVGYVPQGFEQHGSFLTGIAVGPGLDSEHLLFRLHKQGLIYGRVTDDRGEPVRNANVQLILLAAPGDFSRRPRVLAGHPTNDLGEYRLASLSAGTYRIVVQAQPWYARPGFAYTPELPSAPLEGRFLSRIAVPPRNLSSDVVYPITFYPGVTDEQSAGEINITGGASREANIQLHAVPALHLHLTNIADQAGRENSFGVGGFQKAAGNQFGLPMMMQRIAPGEFEVAGVPPGDVTLVLNSGDPQGRPEQRIEITARGDATLDAAQAPVAAQVSGRVSLPEAEVFLANASVVLLYEGGNSPFAQVKKDGSFEFPSVPPGTYKVVADLPMGGAYVRKLTAVGGKLHGNELTISGGGDIQLTVVGAVGAGNIAGVVTMNAKPASGIVILLVPESPENDEDDRRMDQSDSDGSFSLFAIIPGKYRLLAIQDGWDLDWRDPAVLNPYLTKALPLQITPSDSKKLTLEVQAKVK